MLFDVVRDRLQSFGYDVQPQDDTIISFAIQKAENTVRNSCNINIVPDGLVEIVVDMAAGEFLMAKKTFAPDSLAALDLDFAVKQIQVGDTNTVFATGDGSLTAEQRLDRFINYLLTYGRDQLFRYRRMIW